MEKKYIQFHESMTSDKRNPDFAYLRKNIYRSKARGMYPSTDFSAISGVPTDADIKSNVNGNVFVQDGSDVKIYNWTGSGALGSPSHTITGKTFQSAVDGNDGVHWMDSNGDIYSNATNIGSTTSSGFATASIFDGLYYYYFADNKIFRQLKSASPTLVFNDTGDEVIVAFSHSNHIFFITEDGLNYTVHKWGKDSATLVDRRFEVTNSRFLAGGNVGGVATFVHSVGDRQNSKEKSGSIVVSTFNGETLEEKNSIKAGSSQILRSGNVTMGWQSVGNEIMVFAVSSNVSTANPTLYHDYVYKVQNNGAIEVIFNETITDALTVQAVDIQYDYITIGISDNFYANIDTDTTYGGYGTKFENAVYATNFLDFTSSKHKFGGIGVSFEKLFNNDEQLDIYYRLSDRDDWSLIKSITTIDVINDMDMRQDQDVKNAEVADTNVGLNIQTYEATKDTNGDSLKEYYEIQFKLESKKGFSVIDFWYYTDAQKRVSRG